MLPDDANPAGNVHGGSILKMIEHAGYIAATRHCNSATARGPQRETYVALARLERMDFLAPMHIGEVAQLEARVTWTTRRSVEVCVRVWSEQPAAVPPANARRLTNTAWLWYVPVQAAAAAAGGAAGTVPAALQWEFVAVDAPPLLGMGAEEQEAGKERHAASKRARALEAAEEAAGGGDDVGRPKIQAALAGEPSTAGIAACVATTSSSRATLCQLVLPSDCYSGSQRCFGGVIMKLIDNAAGIVAVRHCRTNVVTASFEAMNFLAPVTNGNLLTIDAVATFTSSRSLEIGVTVMAEKLHTGEKRVTSRCRLTFVSLSPEGRVRPIPQLKPSCLEEEGRFAAGQARYEKRKAQRLAAKAAKTKAAIAQNVLGAV